MNECLFTSLTFSSSGLKSLVSSPIKLDAISSNMFLLGSCLLRNSVKKVNVFFKDKYLFLIFF